MKNNNRTILILKYLFENSDSLHTVTIADINYFLRSIDLDADRKTVSECLNQLIEIGYDIECVRKKQNHYYMNSRSFSLPEIKLLVDAVQSSRFISEANSFALIEKLSKLVGEHHGKPVAPHIEFSMNATEESKEDTELSQDALLTKY